LSGIFVCLVGSLTDFHGRSRSYFDFNIDLFAEKVILILNHFETGDSFYFDLKSLFGCVILILTLIYSICNLSKHLFSGVFLFEEKQAISLFV